jgi:hypothetical protein
MVRKTKTKTKTKTRKRRKKSKNKTRKLKKKNKENVLSTDIYDEFAKFKKKLKRKSIK